jgi:hypothetical protein
MKTMKTDKQYIEISTVNTVSCNSCGKTIVCDEFGFGGDMTELNVTFGYGSRFDNSLWTFDLCDDCIDAITEKFQIPIDKQD